MTAGTEVDLLNRLGQLIEESGGVRNTDELSAFLRVWLEEPLPELGGETPAQALRGTNGFQRVETILERMRGGLPG